MWIVAFHAYGQRRGSVVTDTNAVLLAPTNFFRANSNLLNQAVGSTASNLNAANIATGTLPDARLATNVARLDGTNNSWSGTNTFTNINNTFIGTIKGSTITNSTITNAAFIGGNVSSLSNGTYLNPVFTNAQNYGAPFRSPGAQSLSEQFGTSASANGIGAVAFGNTAIAIEEGATAVGTAASATNYSSSAFGAVARAWATNATAIGATSHASNHTSTAIGYGASTTTTNQVRLGRSTETVSIPGSLRVDGTISGNVGNMTNGNFLTPTFNSAQNIGAAFRSPGVGSLSDQIGDSADAFGANAVSIGTGSIAGENAVALGNGTVANQSESTAIGYQAASSEPGGSAFGRGAVADQTNSTALGRFANTTAANQIRLGVSTDHVSIPGGLKVDGNITNAHFAGTNTFDSGSDVSFGRYALTSLASSNNAAVPVGTNVFVEVSGPSTDFNINGIANGRDGKFIIILNRTGFNMNVSHESGVDPVAANRIVTMTAADRITTGNGAATLIYSGAASRWMLIGFEP